MDANYELVIVGRVALAGALGAIVGLERELKQKPAGLRTHLLVAAAAALLVELGEVMIRQFQQLQSDRILRADPIRIIEAVTAGISFIGAGTIIFDRSRHRLEGITTAAGILVTAGIGMAIGLQAYVVGVSIAVLVAGVLAGLGWLEGRFGREDDGDVPGDRRSTGSGAIPPHPHED